MKALLLWSLAAAASGPFFVDEALRAGAHPSVLWPMLQTSADMLALLGAPVDQVPRDAIAG